MAKILLRVRFMRDFFIDQGTIFLLDDIPNGILLLDLGRFGVVLYCVLHGVLWFLEACFDVPSDGLKL